MQKCSLTRLFILLLHCYHSSNGLSSPSNNAISHHLSVTNKNDTVERQNFNYHDDSQWRNIIASSYVTYWDKLLTDEYRASVEELKERREKWSNARLEASGMSIFGASAEPDGEVFGDKIVRIHKRSSKFFNKDEDKRGGGKLLRDNFTRGDVLILTPENDGLGRTIDYPTIPRECLVVDVGDDWMTVAVGNTWPLGLWETRRKNTGAFLVRLDRTAAQAPMKAQKNTLDLLRRGKAGKAAMILAGLAYDDRTVFESFLTAARQKPFYFDSFYEGDLKDDIWNAIQDVKTNNMTFEPNQSQIDAISYALQRHISLIRGPPGTGKTRCAAILIATALRLKRTKNLHVSEEEENDANKNPNQSPKVLAVAHSNGAADVLLEALLNMGVAAVRLGRPSSVSPKVQHRTVVAIADKVPVVKELRQQIMNTSLDNQSRSAAEFDLKQYLKDIQKAIIQNAPVIVTSCIGAYQLLDEDVSFPIVVLDEAAQTTEPALICSLAVAKAESVVLIGDTKQLPPTITSNDLRKNLGISPMSRLENLGIDEVTLGIQYRMSPSLLEHPSKYFYNGLVSCATENMKEDALPSGFPWPNSLPLAFIHSGENNEFPHNFGGRSNPIETNIIMTIISSLIDHGDINAKDIAVITPYSKQVQAIRMELSNLQSLKQLKQVHQIKVGTVDSFQGQETDLVIFSAVRSNEIKDLGFLRDSRRLNVAITRAKKGLILIGDITLLRTCRHWAALIDSCNERGCLIESSSALQYNEIQPLMRVKQKTDINDNFDLDESDEFYGLFS